MVESVELVLIVLQDLLSFDLLFDVLVNEAVAVHAHGDANDDACEDDWYVEVFKFHDYIAPYVMMPPTKAMMRRTIAFWIVLAIGVRLGAFMFIKAFMSCSGLGIG